MTDRIVTRCTVRSDKISAPVTFAVAADLHNGSYDDVLPEMEKADAILIVGDLMNRHRKGYGNAAAFLRNAPRCAPTFYAIGNHEWKAEEREAFWPLVIESDVTVLDNTCTRLGEVALGGLSSRPEEEIDSSVVEALAAQPGFRLLMCHHPEWYPRLVQGRGIDLTVAGHAHGGQIQLWGQGIYSPNQGLFPRYTHGFYDGGRLLVSRGMTNSCGMPRWGNPCELIMLTIAPV